MAIAVMLLVACEDVTPGSVKKAAESPAVLRVVGLFPMTGPGASLGTFLNNGVQLAKEDLEREYAGKLKIQFEVVDSQNKPREAVNGLRSAIARNRPAAVISGLSSVSSAIKPIVEQEGIFTVATTTALNNLVQGTQHLVRVYPTANNFAEPIARYTVGRFKTVAVLYINDDFGASVFNEYRKRLAGSQTIITSAEAYELLQKDTRTLIDRIAYNKPEAVYVIGYGPAYIRLIKQLKEQVPNVSVIADISFANPAVLAALGQDAENVVFNGTDAELTEPETEAAALFRKRYIARFNAEPFMVAGFAYDSLKLIVKASMRDGSYSVPKKATAIKLSPFSGIMGIIQLDSDGESNISLRLMQRQSGKTIPVIN